MATNFRKTGKRMFLALAGLALGFALGELAVRLLPLGLPEVILSPLNLNASWDSVRPDGQLRITLKSGIERVPFATSDYTIYHVSTESPDQSEVGFREQFRGRESSRSWLNDWFSRHSCLFKLYKHTARGRSSKVAQWSGDGARYSFARQWLEALDLRNREVQRGLELYREELARVHALGEQHGFTPVFLGFGFKEQVYFEEFRSVVGHDLPPREEVDQAYRQVLAWARSLGIPMLDLAERFRRVKKGQIYFVVDGHLTREGSRLAGEQIAEFLRAEHLLD